MLFRSGIMNKIFKTIWNKFRQAYVAVSEISQPQHGHGFRSTGMIGLISLVWSAEALALGPSFVTDPTVDHRRTDNSIAIEREWRRCRDLFGLHS